MDEHPHAPDLAAFNPAVVYRALPYDNFLRSDGSHKDNLFLRHARRDPNGLSVTTTIRTCRAQFDRPIFGIRRVDVVALRLSGLQLFPTSETHANIRFASGENIPIPSGEGNPSAREIAIELMRISVPLAHWDAENADEIEAGMLNPN